MRQRVRVHGVVVDEVLVELVGRQEAKLTLGALAHAATIVSATLIVALFSAGLLGSAELAAQTPDPLRERQWYLDRVHAEDAWAAGRGDGVVVAVVDTGVDATHPDLAGRVGRGVDLVDEGTTPDDPNGHGTLVAGVIGALVANGEGIHGAAPGVQIMPVRVLDADGNGNSDLVARGVRWAADNDADVINLSLAEVPGLLTGIGGLLGSELEDAIRYADERGAVVVAAAGNDGRSSTPYRSGLPLLIVGATDRDDRIWASSNRDSRTVFAPGVGIVSTWRDGGYGEANGTSFATPIVAAAAAIVRGQGHGAAETRRRVEAATTPVGAGRGRVDLARAAGVEPTPTTSPSPSSTAPPPPPATATPAPTGGTEPSPTDTLAPSAAPTTAAPPVTGESPAAPPPATVEPVETAPPPVPDPAPDVQLEVGTAPAEDAGSPWTWPALLLLVGVLGLFARAARR